MMDEFRKITNRIFENEMKKPAEEASRAKAFNEILITKLKQLSYEVDGETKYRDKTIRAFNTDDGFYIHLNGGEDDIEVALRVYPPNNLGEGSVYYCGFTDSTQKNVEFAEKILAKDIGIELKYKKYKIL